MIAHASDTAEDGNKHVDLFGTKPCLTTATGPETAIGLVPSAPTRALSKWRKRLWNWLRDYWWFWTIFVAFRPICRAMASTPVQQALLQGQFTEITISFLNVEWVLYLEIVNIELIKQNLRVMCSVDLCTFLICMICQTARSKMQITSQDYLTIFLTLSAAHLTP